MTVSHNPVHIIVNPASAGGKTGRRMAEILSKIDRCYGKRYSLFVTQKSLQAGDSASEAVRNGARLVIAVGGDGTLQEVVNGLFSNGHLMNPDCHLGIVCSGTGKGFAQSIGLPAAIQDQIELIHEGHFRSVDIAKVHYRNREGVPSYRYYLNECQLGIGGAVVRNVQQNHKRLGGTLAFGLGTLETTFRYRNQSMTVTANVEKHCFGRFTGIVIANGAYTGGGMNLTPGARVDDGQLNVLLMHDLSIVQRLRVFPRIYSGSHVRSALFTHFKASTVTVESDEQVLVEADGELLGTTPCTVKVLPSQLCVCI